MPAAIKRALISVYDKTGIVEFARALHGEFGIEILSTGGTAKLLRDSGIPVTLVEEVTGFGEMLDGRVKTLHPKIHAAILADRDKPEHMQQLSDAGIEPIDMVVVNLYPFAETVADPNCTFEDAIEMIDIGGPCMLRAAAKNHRHVVPIVQTEWLEYVLSLFREAQGVDEAERFWLAGIAFNTTRSYDRGVEEYFAQQMSASRLDSCGDADFPAENSDQSKEDRVFYPKHVQELRYGENPHQMAAFIDQAGEELSLRSVVSGGTLSFNNLADADAALLLCTELTRPCGATQEAMSRVTPVCVFVKHTNACGAGRGSIRDGAPQSVEETRVETYRRAYLGDPNAAMGGVLAVNFRVDAGFAETVMETYQRFGKPLKDLGHPAAPGAFFIELWLAPAFDDDAIDIIQTRKKWGNRVRLLGVGDTYTYTDSDSQEQEHRTITGGMLLQTRDTVGLNEDEWKVVTKRTPTDTEMRDLRLAWLVCKHTKSNAISLCKDGMLIGNGAGQMSRVMSCRIATWLATENGHAAAMAGSAAASDAFFPFRDGPDVLIDAGVRAIIQPGGSKRDAETIAACDARDVAMIFTGTRHFKH